MRENSGKESKAIKVLFQKLIDDNYKQKEYRDIYIVDILPRKVVNIDKYSDFENIILKNNSYNVLNKFVLSMSKLYLYDSHILKLVHDEEENFREDKETQNTGAFTAPSVSGQNQKEYGRGEEKM